MPSIILRVCTVVATFLCWDSDTSSGYLFSIEDRGGFRGSSLGSLELPFLKLATHQQTLTELADTHSSSLELRSAVQSRQTAKT